jgi:hypothetical protein
MNWSSEKYPWLSLLLGFALAFVWGVISLAHAYDRSLAKMKDSYARGFMLVERLGGVLDTLARLRIDQQAFLSTGDDSFQDGVVESAETLTLDVSVLNSLAARNTSERPLLLSLSRSIEQSIASVADSDHLREVHGKADAIAYFDAQENAISLAKWQAEQLRIQIAGRISDHVQSARSANALLQDFLFYAPVGTVLKRGAAISKAVNLAAAR